jgi:hypothetical protein
MSYLLILILLLVMVIIFINRENGKLRDRASAELRYEIARHQLDEWNTKYGKAE